ncbi:P-loop containing nucleoside triphosphate hydrolase protein [Xylariaceae sp. FL0662B]|nr:P-loop containing nucleoside triphosphate hydrolase protein [Xylariaceae sp. FL0662B]
MDGIRLDSTAIEQLHGEQKGLLDTIDDLRKHGIDRFVDLPQIIVIGDQSSGKSSVLEAISRVRFPVKDGLCTRFATELVLRTSSQPRVDVRIQPTATSNKTGHSFNETTFDKDQLPRIIDLAKVKMLGGDTTFSEDVLRVEVSGPDVPHLTLVDLPGFYHSEDENQSAAGRDVVDRLVGRYMARKNSIMLAIISARNQVILQKVLSKVKQYDSGRERTLGIVTKPDTLTPGSQDEENFIRLVKNLDRSHELSLGWHVLRNRGETEGTDSNEQRDQKELEFFESDPWSDVPSKNRGAEALRKKLSSILLDHIRNNLHHLIEKIEEHINDRQAKLKRLGESRSTPRELRAHLDKFATQFHILSLHAVEGNYADEFFGGLYPKSETTSINESRIKKLRALIRDLNRAFAFVLTTKGSRRIITPNKSTADINDKGANRDKNDGHKPLGKDELNISLPLFLQPLADQYHFKAPEIVSFESITEELESLSSANQGNEFPGTSNDRLAVKLFQDQSQPWEAIARRHIQLVLHVTKAFVERLVGHITGPDTKTCYTILSDVVDPFFDQKAAALEAKLQELLYHFKSGYPQPLDTEFRQFLARRRRQNTSMDVLEDLLASRPELFTKTAREELRETTATKHSSEFGVDDLIDKSETYYEMSLRTFTDNVIVLAIENCLIRDLPSIFTTEKVNQMDDSELACLASESPEIQVNRNELQAEYDALKRGLELCNKYRPRKVTSLPTILVGMDNLSLASRTSEESAQGMFTAPKLPEKEAGKPKQSSQFNFDKPNDNSGIFSGQSFFGPSSSTPTFGSGLFGHSHHQNSSPNTFNFIAPEPATNGLFETLRRNSPQGGASSASSPQASRGLFGNYK